MARIVMIDKNTLAREALGSMLTKMGHTVRTSAEGWEGRHLAAQWPADLVIIDAGHEGLEGMTTLLDMKSDCPDMPVVMVSTGGTVGGEFILDICHSFGADETLQKPINYNNLKWVTDYLMDFKIAA